MPTQFEYATTFANLHIVGIPLILFNIWDAGTAQAVQDAGAKAIATSSLSVAAANGFQDGEQLPLDLVIANLVRIVSAVDLPVTIDIEGGYGQNVEAIQQTISRVIEAGAIGINFEDQIMGKNGLYSIEEQCEKIAAIRQIADQMSIPLFINARTDIFLQLGESKHHQQNLEQVIDRGIAYAQSGANGFFVPGLQNPQLIEELCERLPVPVNTMFLRHGLTPKQMADLGVARISYGPYPYRQVVNMLKTEADISLKFLPL